MKAYLVPTDFSENANNALEYAAEIAKVTGRKILLHHAYTPLVAPYHMVGPLVTESIDSTIQAIKDKLEVICRTLMQEYPEIDCSAHVSMGEIVAEIVEMSKKMKVELIIMGTYGASKIENVLFGSNTSLVIEKSECPVFSVPFSVPFRTPYKMLFATNFTYNDLKGAMELVAIAKAFNATVIIAHIMTDNSAIEPDEKAIRKFSREVALLTDYPHITYKIISDNTVTMGLDAIIAETHADMIALSMQKRGLFEQFYNPSITKKFSSHGIIPLLAFHGSENNDEREIDFQ